MRIFLPMWNLFFPRLYVVVEVSEFNNLQSSLSTLWKQWNTKCLNSEAHEVDECPKFSQSSWLCNRNSMKPTRVRVATHPSEPWCKNVLQKQRWIAKGRRGDAKRMNEIGLSLVRRPLQCIFNSLHWCVLAKVLPWQNFTYVTLLSAMQPNVCLILEHSGWWPLFTQAWDCVFCACWLDLSPHFSDDKK